MTDLSANLYQTIRLPLKSIIRDPDKNISQLLIYVNNMHVIMTLGYQFLRLYILEQFQQGHALPLLNKDFCYHILCIIMDPQKARKANSQLQKLKDFYQEQFKPLIPSQLIIDGSKLSTIAQALSTEMSTALHNNIALHFVKRLKRIIIYLLQAKEEFKSLSKGQIRRAACLIIDALWLKDASQLSARLLDTYNYCLQEFIPVDDYVESLGYDLVCNTDKYLFYTLKMNQYLENHDYKLFQPICLRHSNVPKNIPIDTKAIIYLLDETIVFQGKIYTKMELLHYYKSLVGLQAAIWNTYFKMDKKILNKKTPYIFCYSIATDGIGCSLKYILKKYVHLVDNAWKKGAENTRSQLSQMQQKVQKRQEAQDTQMNKLVSHMSPEEKALLCKRPLVGCDPGLANLVQLVNNQGRQVRYTKRQRYQETYISHNQKIRQKLRSTAGIIALEQALNVCQSKTLNIAAFKHYITIKNQTMLATLQHYRDLVYRKLQLRHFIHVKKSESRLLNLIEQQFGRNCVIFYGNWSRQNTMKHNAPVPGRGLKRLIASRFTVVTVDEYKTSTICPYNNQIVENKYLGKRKIHRCLICQECCSFSNGSKIRRYMNRDIMAGLNQLKIGASEILDNGRPEAYQRVSKQKVEREDPFALTPRIVPKKVIPIMIRKVI